MNLAQVQSRLVLFLREKVRNGEITERAFARIAGISQPHIHKVLKGTRTLSLDRLDLVLKCLNVSLLDFCTEIELNRHLEKLNLNQNVSVEIPFLKSPLGPGCRWNPEVSWAARHRIPCRTLGPARNLMLARLTPDPAMNYTAEGLNLAAISRDHGGSLDPEAVYVCDRGYDAVLRRIRRGLHHLYLVSDVARDQPPLWKPSPLGDGVPAIRGRVVWLGFLA